MTFRPSIAGILAGGAVGVLLLVGVGVDDDIALVYGGGIALCVTIALGTQRGERDVPFARWLLVVTGLWALSALANSGDEVLYSVGRVAAWLIEPLLLYLLLAFPYGRLRTASERRVAIGTALVAGLLYLPTALLGEFPLPSPWAASCGLDCPDNAFALTSWEGADVLRAVREPLTVGLFAWAAWLIVARARGKGAAIRALLAPVACIAVVRVALIAGYFAGRVTEQPLALLEPLGWAYIIGPPAVAIAFAVGRLRQRLFAAEALEGMALNGEEHANPDDLRGIVARALNDLDLEILYWVDGEDGHWVGAGGWPTSLDRTALGDDRTVTVVRTHGRPVAALVHDRELPMNAALVQTASRFVLTALQHEDLTRQLRESVGDLHYSRARIVSAADTERQRIERDLHDGAQQRLVALRIQLTLMAERLTGTARDESIRIQDLEHEVDLTIEELRSFAHGIYPPLLSERGLAEALRAAARAAPVPTSIEVHDLQRYPLPIELTVYFGCMEALQNAVKHGHMATAVWITVHDNDELVFKVRDDGQGFRVADVPAGAGLTNMADRLAAVSGTLSVESAPGTGTTITGTIPL